MGGNLSTLNIIYADHCAGTLGSQLFVAWMPSLAADSDLWVLLHPPDHPGHNLLMLCLLLSIQDRVRNERGREK
jgi:hypothetical protein